LRADVVEIPISYRQRGEKSHSKLNTIRDGIRILNFALTNWIAPLLSGLTALMAGVLGFRVVAGFLETGWPYATTATGAVASGFVAFLALFHGVTLRILCRNDKRREIVCFLEAKREWNARLDATLLERDPPFRPIERHNKHVECDRVSTKEDL
jgi:hypothetical protein